MKSWMATFSRLFKLLATEMAMPREMRFRAVILAASVLTACAEDPSAPGASVHAAAGGVLTIQDATAGAFSRPAPGLPPDLTSRHRS